MSAAGACKGVRRLVRVPNNIQGQLKRPASLRVKKTNGKDIKEQKEERLLWNCVY
jgi:hypothetical protein